MQVPPVPRLVLYGLTAVIILALIVAASTSTAAFGAYNIEWDGTSDVREIAATETDSVVALDTDAYTETTPSGTVAVVLAPERAYEPEDTERIRSFVADGGTLLVADNFGATQTADPHGNQLLAAVGATARFDGAPLRDERHYYQSPALPVATPVATHPYTTGVEELTLNYGTAIEPNDAETLVETSEFAYRDTDWSGDLSDDEELGRYPVVTVESVGDGEVVTVGDPSIFINSMLARDGNAAFTAAVFTAHDRSILDYSANSAQPPLAALLIRFQNTPLLQVLGTLVGVGAAWSLRTWSQRERPLSHRLLRRLPERVVRRLGVDPASDTATDQSPLMSEDELTAYLRAQHPTWDDDRLQRIVTGIIRERTRQQTNE